MALQRGESFLHSVVWVVGVGGGGSQVRWSGFGVVAKGKPAGQFGGRAVAVVDIFLSRHHRVYDNYACDRLLASVLTFVVQ